MDGWFLLVLLRGILPPLVDKWRLCLLYKWRMSLWIVVVLVACGAVLVGSMVGEETRWSGRRRLAVAGWRLPRLGDSG